MDPLLKETQEAFTKWRAAHKRQCPVKKDLKKKALILLEQYPLLTVSEATGVAQKTLSHWKDAVDLQKESGISFISLPLETTIPIKDCAVNDVNKYTELLLTLPGDLQLTLPNQSLDKTIQFIHALSKEFCS